MRFSASESWLGCCVPTFPRRTFANRTKTEVALFGSGLWLIWVVAFLLSGKVITAAFRSETSFYVCECVNIRAYSSAFTNASLITPLHLLCICSVDDVLTWPVLACFLFSNCNVMMNGNLANCVNNNWREEGRSGLIANACLSKHERKAKNRQSCQFETLPWLDFRRSACQFHSADLHFHEWRNMRLVAGRQIIDHSLRPRCWLALGLKWVTLSSANLLRGEKMDINLLASNNQKSYLTPTQPNSTKPNQTKCPNTSLSWFLAEMMQDERQGTDETKLWQGVWTEAHLASCMVGGSSCGCLLSPTPHSVCLSPSFPCLSFCVSISHSTFSISPLTCSVLILFFYHSRRTKVETDSSSENFQSSSYCVQKWW